MRDFEWDDDPGAAPYECERCGRTHLDHRGDPGCHAHNRHGLPCTKTRRKGQAVCATHGGNSAQALRAAEKRLAEAEAHQAVTRAIETFGAPSSEQVDPGTRLMRLIQVSAGLVDWYLNRIRENEASALVWGVVETKTEAAGSARLTFGGREVDDEDYDTTGLVDFGSAPASEVKAKAAPSVWLSLYNAERDRLAALCKVALEAGVQERQVRLAEQQGALINSVLRRILDDLHLTPDQQALLPTVVPGHLRAISSAV